MASRDGGRSWQELGLMLGERDAVAFLAVHPAEPDTIYAATFGLALLRSQDGGRSWRGLDGSR